MMYAGRSIQGFCVGLTTLTLPIYLGETIQPEVRGTLGLLPTTIGNVGILFCYILGSYIDWKILAAIGAFLPLPFLVFMWFIPETPRWYISKGRYQDARTSLQWLRGGKTDVQDEFYEIESNYKLQQEQSKEGGVKQLLKMAYVRPLLISLGLMFFQQMSGINAVIFYTVSIFERSGGSVDSNLSSIIVGLANFFATLGSNLVIDKVGRKLLLNLSGFFMAVSLGALGVFFLLQHLEQDVTHLGWLPLATFIVYIVAFSIGYGPIPWLMVSRKKIALPNWYFKNFFFLYVDGRNFPEQSPWTCRLRVNGFQLGLQFRRYKVFPRLDGCLGSSWSFLVFWHHLLPEHLFCNYLCT